MATGTITSLRNRSVGFIARDGGQPPTGAVFFDRSAVGGSGYDRLREGQRVSFDIEPDPRDPTHLRAVNVQGTGGEPAWE